MTTPATLLYIDDNELDRRAFSRLVREKRLPWNSTLARTLADARARLAEAHFDVIVADYHLPDGDCTELFDEVPDTPFILLTGTLEEQLALRTLSRGADDYLAKDAAGRHLEALPFAVEKTLYRKRICETGQRLNRELRESAQRLRASFDHAASGIIEVGPDFRIVNANQRFCEMLGCGREELVGKSVHDLTYPEDQPRSDQLNLELREGRRERLDYEKRYVNRAGEPVWVRVAASAIRDDGGQALGYIVTVQDIRQRKAAETVLEQTNNQLLATVEELQTASEELAAQNRVLEAARETLDAERRRYRDLFEGAPDGYVVTDPSGAIVAANQAALAMLGLNASHAPDLPLAVFVAKDHQAPFLAALAGLRRGEPVRFLQVDIGPKRGAKFHSEISASIEMVSPEQPLKRFRWLIRDISERKRAEQELNVAKAAAEQASRAKDHFLAVLSHELRTPLTPVLATVSMLQADPKLDSEARETLEVARRNAELEARLIDDLLDLTRIVRGKVELRKQPARLCDIVQRAVEVCRPDIEARGLHFTVDLGAPHWVLADAARLQQVFWNLLKNAVKFTPHGGRVAVLCRPGAGGTVVTEVSDSGQGIEPEALERIFNAFEQAQHSLKQQFGGLGLGLTISKALVEMHGGTIEAHSPGKGRGATFRVALPTVSAPTTAGMPAAAPQRAAARQARALRILLVEDHGDTVKIMKRLLERQGYKVRTAADVASALEVASSADIDLLVSDLGLPDGSGLDLMRQLRQRQPTLKAIALSGYGMEADLEHSREAGFAEHLTKPIEIDTLLEAVDRLCTQQQTAD
jgi:two-component system CheB/CheR fusion protein